MPSHFTYYGYGVEKTLYFGIMNSPPATLSASFASQECRMHS